MYAKNYERELQQFVDWWDEGQLSLIHSQYQQLVKLWEEILADVDVTSTLQRMLYIPNYFPNWHDARMLLVILKHIDGQLTSWPTYDDLQETRATITQVKIQEDEEGPTYRFTYFFVDQQNQTHIYQGQLGYDITHVNIAGIKRSDLDKLYKIGAQLAVKYRANDPSTFCIGHV